MHISIEAGEFKLKSGAVLSGALTRSEFLSSFEGGSSSTVVENEPHHSFKFKDEDESIIIVVCFKGENLNTVEFCLDDPKYGSSWSEWSEEKEMKRKKDHETWLKTKGLAHGKVYSWGCVKSVYDQRAGCSTVVVSFHNGS